jgi:hypothetical protein
MADSPAREITRRGFLARVGQGLAAANVAGTFIHNTTAQQFVPDPQKSVSAADQRVVRRRP